MKTTFRTRFKHYKYTIMLFELTNVSTTCQEMINNALRQYFDIFVIVYLNDKLIFSKIYKKHVCYNVKLIDFYLILSNLT